ncbi:acyltransferase family protein [Nocardiopsis gilva]|uniref:acyltransferase family protein n=1 Tax=Nocardiopsis gilva TaxID=280236 RepID=UPI000A0297E2|nr:acyltransferase family protein [Nocardiopsis gilva]
MRILLTVLVVLHHVAVTYGNIPAWYYMEPAQDASGGLLDVLVVFNQAFFMGFFFLISGYFVPGACDRRGGRAFLRARLVRLGIPLLLFLLLLRPLVTAFIYREHASDVPYWLFYIVSWDPGPLWFVETLLVFCLGYVLIRRLRRPRASIPAPGAGAPDPALATRPLPGVPAVIGCTVALALITYLWRILVPIGSYWPIIGLPTPNFLPQYVALFALGAVAYRRRWLERIPTWAGWAGLATAVVAALAYVPGPISGLGDATMLPGTWQSLAVAAWETTFAVGVVFALLVLFRSRVNHQGRVARFLSANAYAVYFLHPVVLVGLGVAFRGWEAIALAKFTVVALVALPVCWGAAHLLRRLPGATRVF